MFAISDCKPSFLAGALALALSSAGCQVKAPGLPPKATPTVPVSVPVSRMVTETVDFTGRTDAVESVSIKPRVTGYLEAMPFKQGSEVKKGDLLFVIDPRPYKVLVDQAVANVVLNQSAYDLAKVTLGRDRGLGGAVSQQQLDQDKATLDQADARVKAAQAAVETAKLNLEFTRVLSPINGRISRYYYTVGNLVTQDSTTLTTIVSEEQMYVYFDLDERTYNQLKLQIAERRRAKTGEPSADAAANKLVVSMALEGEKDFPHTGEIDFINNQINSSTGTIAVRGLFKNQRVGDKISKAGDKPPKADDKMPKAGDKNPKADDKSTKADDKNPKAGEAEMANEAPWLFTPGNFVRVRLPVAPPKQKLLVKDSAIGSDQGIKFVYVVDGESKVQYRKVVTGSLQEDGLRVVEDYAKAKTPDGKDLETGLKPDERVVVGGLQQVRPRDGVIAELVPMPTSATAGVGRKPQPPVPGEKPSGKKSKE